MALTKIRLGDLMVPFAKACGIADLDASQVSGINREKEFFEPSRQVGSDTSKYQVVPPHYFACNLMHVGRDKVLPIAYNHSDGNKFVSPAYSVFSLKMACGILEEYFFLMLKSEERDRYFWFQTDSSIRDGMSWEDFCSIEMDVPSLSIQQKYVNVYKSLLANQQSYECGLEDIKLTFDALIDEYKHSAPRKAVGLFLSEVDHRNSDGSITDVQGINITKQFMPSVADTLGVDLTKYKIVENGEFAYSGMQTGRDECIRIALFTGEEPIIISPAYTVLQINDDSILSEYLMMWFSRAESDRLGWFMSDGSIRANLDLDRFYETEIPVPEVSVQKALVELYASYIERRKISERLKAQIKEICPVLIKGSIEEAQKEL